MYQHKLFKAVTIQGHMHGNTMTLQTNTEVCAKENAFCIFFQFRKNKYVLHTYDPHMWMYMDHMYIIYTTENGKGAKTYTLVKMGKIHKVVPNTTLATLSFEMWIK